MFRLRATKYDPANRDDEGRYLVDEWISVHDIGGKFGGRVFTESDYMAVESSYVSAISDLLTVSESSSLQIVDLEDCGEARECPVQGTLLLQQEVGKISSGLAVTDERVVAIARLALREVVWCKLQGENGTYIHFGHDYYMYLGTNLAEASMPVPPSRLYYEPRESPYATS